MVNISYKTWLGGGFHVKFNHVNYQMEQQQQELSNVLNSNNTFVVVAVVHGVLLKRQMFNTVH